MSVPLISAPFPFERNHIRSGPITRDGFGDYGVIFSARKNGSANDFHPADLTGAIIEVTELRQKGEPNRFFTILGGYYCERNPGGRPDEVAISHLFGVANDPALGFELSPGNHCLVDQWKMKDLSGNRATNMMDERDKGEDGWTFIVNYKPFRHQYPFSGKPMEVLRECPVITSFIVRNTGSTDSSVNAEAEATILHAPARKYVFDWGDGSPLEESDSPQASHQFTRPSGGDASFTVTISVVGPDGCASSQSSVFVVPGTCPVARISESGVSYPSNQLAQADLTIEVTHQDGMQYAWLWGDQTEPEVTDLPQHSHRYTRGLEQETFKVSVTVKGPGTCESTVGTTVSVDPKPCPVLVSVNAGIGQMNGGLFEVPFTLTTEQEDAEEYVWDFGDGSEPVKTTRPEASHGFHPGAGIETNRTVTVTANGPGSSCSSSASTSLLIPGQCPIASPTVEILTVSDTKTTVQANLDFTGPTPESWTIDWGDGTTPETVVQGPATHDFLRPAGDQETVPIQITAGGPGSCTSNHSLTLSIPGTCPVLTKVNTSWEGPVEGTYTLTAEVIGSGPVPDSYQWDWGDGTITTEGATATHQYVARSGEETEVTLTIQASGPDSCNTSISKPENIPALPCPIIGKDHLTHRPHSGDIHEVTFEADFDGGTPGSFTWNWGDGSEPETTPGPSASHQYTAKPGELAEYLVRLTTDGPGACKASTAVWVPIGRFCPIPDQIDLNTSSDENGAVAATIEVGVRGAAPAQIMVNWGDGSPEEEVANRQASHTFSPKPGVNQQFQITVTVKGPGSCGSFSETLEVNVPATCPIPGRILQAQKSLSDNAVSYEFRLEPNIPADSYVWTFGDGASPITTTDPVVTYEYPRWAGQSPEYDVEVAAIGPGPCQAAATTTVTIPEPDICPIISRVDTYIADETDTTVSIGFIPVSIQGVPTQYKWNFGDGSPVLDTTDPEVIHEFVRSAASSVEVSVEGSGPGACASSQKVQVGIPQSSGCPVLDRLEVSGSQQGGSGYLVRAEAIVSSGKPESYEWDWGDGSPVMTSKGSVVSHEYQLSESEINRTISVKAIGPGNCEDQKTASLMIPAGNTKPHPWCKWWPYLVGFMASLAGGSWLVCPAAAVDPAPSGWVPWIILILIIALGAVIWLWQRNGTKRNCPPGLCGGLAVGWTMFLTMAGVAFFLNDCLPSWMGWGIGSLVIAGGLAGWWFARCAKTSGARVFFTYFAISVIAFAIVAFLIAMPALACV